MYKLATKHKRRNGQEHRSVLQKKSTTTTRNTTREQLTDAHKQYETSKQLVRNYRMTNSVNTTLALFYSKKIF